VKRHQHEGETVLVLGSGPSVNDFNVDDLHRFTTIGANQISRRLDPDYVTLFDPPHQMGEGIPYAMRSLEKSKVFVSNKYTPQWSTQLPKPFREKQDITEVNFNPRGEWARWDRMHYTPVIESWDDTEDIEDIPYGPTSIAIGVWIAAFAGAARVGLIGVDLGTEYFFPSIVPFATKPNLTRQANIQWGQLHRMVEMLTPTRVFNLSERSLVDSIPRANLTEWLLEQE